GRRIATVGDEHFVRTWDVPSRSEVGRLEAAGMVFALAHGSDGELLALCANRRTGALDLWGLRAARTLRALGPSREASHLALAPHGRTVAILGPGGGLSVRDAVTGRERRRFDGERGPFSSLLFSRGGDLLQSRGTVARLWDVASGKERAHFEVGPFAS